MHRISLGRSFARLVFAALMVAMSATQATSQPPPDASQAPGIRLALPDQPVRRDAVSRASRWLVEHIQTGQFERDGRSSTISVIAWKDPTLAPDEPSLLAGYTITDTLWAAKALSLTAETEADRLRKSLEILDCQGNGLHEVLWTRLARTLHAPADDDVVHGASLGVMQVSSSLAVDLRTFHMRHDASFTAHHPRLFAEHAVYAALGDFWNGRREAARDRIRRIFRTAGEATADDPICWDRQHRALIDRANFDRWRAYRDGRQPNCFHASFKLALVLYALRVFELEEEFADQQAELAGRLWEAQHPDGGVAHIAIIDISGSRPAPGATGEATAAAILGECVKLRHRESP